jgi:O-antigen/teichoic acid export membrane protein
MSESLKEKTAKGLFWGFTNNGVQQLIGVVFGIILGRLLDQADYGMMTMIAIFPLIAKELQNSGFTVALTNMKEPSHRDYNSVFWFNIFVGCGIYVLLFLLSPLIAKFYHEPELTKLCRYAFLTIPLSALGTAQSAVLFKNLKVKQQAKAGMFSVLISSIIGATMAWMGFKYWSLATQNIVYIGLNTLLVWHYSPWRPTMELDFGPVKRMFPFSCKMLATNIAIHINNNVLNILLGRFFTKEVAGTYSQANTWSSKGAYLVQGMVQQVAQPILVKLNDEHDRQLMVLRKMMRFTAFITFPLMFGLALVAKEFIVLAITEKWIASAELMQYLCLSWATIPLTVLLSNMIVSKGKSGTYFWCTVTLAILQLALMVILSRFGMRTMVVGFVVLTCLWLFVWHHFTNRLIGYRLSMFLKDIIPFALIALGVMIVTHYLTSSIENLWILFISRIIIAAALYFIVMKTARAKILDECIKFMRNKSIF